MPRAAPSPGTCGVLGGSWRASPPCARRLCFIEGHGLGLNCLFDDYVWRHPTCVVAVRDVLSAPSCPVRIMLGGVRQPRDRLECQLAFMAGDRAATPPLREFEDS